jgi:OOP family OmpA-OmpF porin
MHNKRAFLAAAVLGLSLPLHAQDVDLASAAVSPYASMMFSYQFADSTRQSKDGLGGVLSGGIPLSQHFNVELGGSFTSFNPDTSAPSYRWRDYAAKLDGMFFFSRNPAFSPYLDIGGGNSHNVLASQSDTKDAAWFADAGVGAMHYFSMFSTPFALRADARYRWTFIDDSKFPGTGIKDFKEPILSIGLVAPFGSSKPAEAPLPPPVVPPAKPPVKTAENPNRKFEDIHFAFDKSDLTDYSKALLDNDATTIGKLSGQYPSLKVDVAGHTDWIGTDAYNQALSERRANAVKDYLIRKGVETGRVRTYSYGESQPIAPNTTSEGRALNRRAEIRTNADGSTK